MRAFINWLVSLWRWFWSEEISLKYIPKEKVTVKYTPVSFSTRIPFSDFMESFGGRGSNYLARLRYSQYLGFKNALSLEAIKKL